MAALRSRPGLIAAQQSIQSRGQYLGQSHNDAVESTPEAHGANMEKIGGMTVVSGGSLHR